MNCFYHLRSKSGAIRAVLLMALLPFNNLAWGQVDSGEKWPAGCTKVDIPSTLDTVVQPAYYYRAPGNVPRPLIVSLHTWSGGYDQPDALVWQCIDQGYHYIHPHFRGPNVQPDAAGSPEAIQDIEDAISWARRHALVDSQQIHVIGSSGGGYATLLTYMHTRHPVRTFSAWVPISNLEDWYFESIGRRQKYAQDLTQVTLPEAAADSYGLDRAEARNRSPYFMQTPVDRRTHSKLYLFAGIHDGYTGSVPVTQSLHMYNKIVRDFDPTAVDAQVTEREIVRLLSARNYDVTDPRTLERGDVHFQRQYRDLVRITLFEGGHEMLIDRALDPVSGKRVLAIGDSNGALAGGWVDQLKALRFQDHFLNTSVSGNTIGFDNLGRKSLNTLRQIDDYLMEAKARFGVPDRVIILLGTNDCKAVFDDSLDQVPLHLQRLIRKIKRHPAVEGQVPEIVIVSPPPYARDEHLLAKYRGAAADVQWLLPQFRKIAQEEECGFVDIHTPLAKGWSLLSADGVHAGPEAQRIIARAILQQW